VQQSRLIRAIERSLAMQAKVLQTALHVIWINAKRGRNEIIEQLRMWP
jgi:hypothetical protein